MNEGADIVAVCITCCTITGLIFGIAGLLFGRAWAMKSEVHLKGDDYDYDPTLDDDSASNHGATTVRHRQNAVVAPSFL